MLLSGYAGASGSSFIIIILFLFGGSGNGLFNFLSPFLRYSSMSFLIPLASSFQASLRKS